MKINEIVISDKKLMFEKLINTDIVDKSVKLYEIINKQTNSFTELAYERYSPNEVNELSDLVLEIYEEMVQYFIPSSQTYKIIEWLF
jgi:hypothetical protein